jgi:hypothetical protein
VQDGCARFCPVVLASELLAQRWMPELMSFDERASRSDFNTLTAGLLSNGRSLL